MPLTVVLMSVLGGTRHWAGPGRRRHGHHRAAVRVHRGRSRGRRQGGVRRGADRRDPVHAARACSAVSRRAGSTPACGVAWQPTAVGAGRAAVAPTRATARRSRRHACSSRAGVRKAFRGVQALDGVDLDVREGEILGLLGPNGSGKSTFINVVSGHYRADGGTIVLRGARHRAAGRAPDRARRHRAHLPDPAAVRAPDRARQRRACRRCSAARSARRARRARREAQRWLEFTGLADNAPMRCPTISTCTSASSSSSRARSRRGRACCCSTRCCRASRRARSTARSSSIRAIRDQGATIVFVEHVMRAVLALTDRIVVLDHGAGDRRRRAPTT